MKSFVRFCLGRRYVNEILLTEGEKYPNLHYHFEHKLTDIDIEKADVTFQSKGETIKVISRFYSASRIF